MALGHRRRHVLLPGRDLKPPPIAAVSSLPCGRAWGHGGNFPGYLELPISSPDGSRQAVLLVNADPSLIPQSQLQQVYHVLNTAYRQGFPS